MYNFFWIASQKYLGEARQSAKSVRKYHPDAELTLFTDHDRKIGDDDFTHVYRLEKSDLEPWFLRSVFYMNIALMDYSNFEKTVYLDTDTYVCGPLDDIFDMLDVFDFVGAQAPGRRTAPTTVPITPAFTEYNIGVQGIMVSSEMIDFFDRWLELYKANKEIYGNNDQAPLREMIWNYRGPLRFGTMPIEYNFRFQMGGQVREPIKILHGRSKDYEKLVKQVNPGSRIIRSWRSGELQ